jgi:NAD(P)H-hydrate repair Nnr-like enzyme with NAD(P)H-hydrate dehydratase domain
LTPHPLEAARLLRTTVAEVQRDRVAAACALAARYNAVVVLKGCGSIVSAPDGRWRINPFGNPGLATAGSGDVLSGMAAAFLAQGLPAFEGLQAAVALHGLAAEHLAATGCGPVGIAAGELIDAARAVRNA